MKGKKREEADARRRAAAAARNEALEQRLREEDERRRLIEIQLGEITELRLEVNRLIATAAEQCSDDERQAEADLADLNELVRAAENELLSVQQHSRFGLPAKPELPFVGANMDLHRFEDLISAAVPDKPRRVSTGGVHVKKGMTVEQVTRIQRARGLRK